MTDPLGSTELWFSDAPDPVACTPLPECAICTVSTEPPVPVWLEPEQPEALA